MKERRSSLFLLVPSTGYRLESENKFLNNGAIWVKLYKNVSKKFRKREKISL